MAKNGGLHLNSRTFGFGKVDLVLALNLLVFIVNLSLQLIFLINLAPQLIQKSGFQLLI